MGLITFPFECKDLGSTLKLISTTDGRYALGKSSFWHGGIHFNLSKDTQAILAPADGEIIAHRTMKKRTTGAAGLTIDHEGNKISSDKEDEVDSSYSFVLTRHTFKTPKEQDIGYYILHMHLLCYENYQEQHKLQPPPYLHNHVQQFVNKDEDKGGSLLGDGVKLRAFAKGGKKTNNVLSILKKGTEFKFKNKGQYNHATPANKYQLIEVLSPQNFQVQDAYVRTGYAEDGELRIRPMNKYYKEYGALYRCRIISPGHNSMGVALYINNKHVGDLAEEQIVYLTEKPAEEKKYTLILDNIKQLIHTDAEGRFNKESIKDGWNDDASLLEPKNFKEPEDTDFVMLASILDEIETDKEKPPVAHIIVRGEKHSGESAKVVYMEEKFTSFRVSSYEGNQCGIAAFSNKSDEHLVNIPYSTSIKSTLSVSIDELTQENKLPVKPLVITQPSEGYLYSGPGYVEQKINELSGVFDKIEIFDKPIAIHSGEVIGYPGSHEKQNITHMELWLNDIDFLDNPEKDEHYESKADLPGGIKARLQTVETRVGKALEVTIPASTKLKASSIRKSHKGKNNDIRKIHYNGKDYFAYRSKLGTWKNGNYITSKTDTAIELYESHPEIATDIVSYLDSTLPGALTVDPAPATVSIDSKEYYPVEMTETNNEGEVSKASYYIEKSEFNKYRINHYDWNKYFKKTNPEDIKIEKNGYFESKQDIEKAVLEEYKSLSESKTLLPQPDYQLDHPLSHLLIKNGSEWSKSYKKSISWADGIIDHMWKLQGVSSLEEAAGITKERVKKVFDQTLQVYSDEISFYDDLTASIAGLPDKNAIWHAHPVRFLGHLNKLNKGLTAPWLKYAWQEMGTQETHDAGKDNPRVIEYHATTTLKADDDETPWCSSFVNWVMQSAGYEGTNSAKAIHWLDWGKKLDKPIVGSIMVVRYPDEVGKTKGRGHVGFVVGKTGSGSNERIVILGGNQGRGESRVKTSPYNPRSSLIKGYIVPEDYSNIGYILPTLTPEDEEELTLKNTR